VLIPNPHATLIFRQRALRLIWGISGIGAQVESLVKQVNETQSELAQLASRAREDEEEMKRRSLQFESNFQESANQWASERRTLEERVSALEAEGEDLRARAQSSERAYSDLQRSSLFESVQSSDQVNRATRARLQPRTARPWPRCDCFASFTR
jgi:predicted  nucleic acid-binding Zn-ribbon protein